MAMLRKYPTVSRLALRLKQADAMEFQSWREGLSADLILANNVFYQLPAADRARLFDYLDQNAPDAILCVIGVDQLPVPKAHAWVPGEFFAIPRTMKPRPAVESEPIGNRTSWPAAGRWVVLFALLLLPEGLHPALAGAQSAPSSLSPVAATPLTTHVPAEFFTHVLDTYGSAESVLASEESLKRAFDTLAQGLQGEERKALQERLIKTYILFNDFKDGGFHGYHVQNEGKDLETFLAPFVMEELKGSWVSILWRMRSEKARKEAEERVYRHIMDRISTSSEFQNRFIVEAHARTISPPMAYFLVGSFLRYFAVSDDVVLKMRSEDNGLVLQVNLGAGRSVLLDMRSGHTAFTAQVGSLSALKPVALLDYPAFAPYMTGPIQGKVAGTILSHISPLRTFDRLAEILAPLFFTHDREGDFTFPRLFHPESTPQARSGPLSGPLHRAA